MKYFSTRNSNEKVSASWAISHGLAPDGGLYVPESLPMLSLDDIKTLGKKDYRGRALSIMKPFLDEFTEDELKAMILRAYGDNFDSADTAPVHFLDEKTAVLELWHGPTCAFKDMALQMLPHLLTASLKNAVSGARSASLSQQAATQARRHLRALRMLKTQKSLCSIRITAFPMSSSSRW